MNDNKISLKEYVVNNRTTIDDLANELRNDVLKSNLYKSDVNKYIVDKCKGLDNDGYKQLFEKIFDPIFKDKHIPYNYLLYKIAYNMSRSIDYCNEQIGKAQKDIDDGSDAELAKDFIQQLELEINDIKAIIDLVVELMNAYNNVNTKYISISILDKYLYDITKDITNIFFPKGSKYERFYLAFSPELIESKDNCIHEEYRISSENKKLIVLPENMKLTLKHKGCADTTSIIAKELKDFLKPTFLDINELADKTE